MEERVAVVTGGLRGLGRAMTLGLARAGHRIVAVGHIESDVADMEAAAGALGVASQIWPLVADLRDANECDRVVAEARARFGAIDILVNNAGWVVDRLFMEKPRSSHLLRHSVSSGSVQPRRRICRVMATRATAIRRRSSSTSSIVSSS